MPLVIYKVPPEIAFTVQYQGEKVAIYHTYIDDIQSTPAQSVYTADKNEGVRTDRQKWADGVQGDYGFTRGNDDDRNEFWFYTHNLFQMMRSLPEFNDLQDPNYKYSYEYEDSFILQTAINHGLVGFDEDYRFIDTTKIEEPIESCTGGSIYPYPYEIKEVSNG